MKNYGSRLGALSRIILAIFILAVIAACEERALAPGVIAEINGEKIYLRSLLNLIDAGFPLRVENPTFADLRENYGRALKTLITRTLVRQELEARGLMVDDVVISDLTARIREEYGEENWRDILNDAYLREEDWRELTRDYAALITFRERALAPKIKIDAPKIKAYYEAEKENFNLPAGADICFLNAADEAELEKTRAALLAGSLTPSLKIQCLEIALADAPAELQKEIKATAVGEFSPPRKINDNWRSVYVRAKKNARRVSMAEAYAFIENILLEKELREAFDAWLEQKLQTARVRLQPDLKKILLENDETEKREHAPESPRKEKRETSESD